MPKIKKSTNKNGHYFEILGRGTLGSDVTPIKARQTSVNTKKHHYCEPLRAMWE